MSKYSDPRAELPQQKNSKSVFSKNSASHLKLVASNCTHIQEKNVISANPQNTNPDFMYEEHCISLNIYEINIQEPLHDLKCNLILDIGETYNEIITSCHFPVMLNKTNQILEQDEELYGIIEIQFQMKVLEQLFLFCARHNSSLLIIYMDDAQAEGFEIYHDFIAHCNDVRTNYSDKEKMLIHTDRATFTKLINFMSDMNLHLEQEMWRGQRDNPFVKHHLKSLILAKSCLN